MGYLFFPHKVEIRAKRAYKENMAKDFKKHLITAALPYANGPLHFGHLTGVYIPADVYARHRRLQGHEVKYISGSDEHGVAIMLSAEKAKVGYREWVDKWYAAHKSLFERFEIQFDFFGRTSAPYHETETLEWFNSLHKQGLITPQTERQLYCIDDGKFLPDRFVEGTCYKCGYEQARGDECPNCGEWIDSIKLKNPVSKISGSRNIEIRETTNFFLKLTTLEARYREEFAKKPHWRKLVRGFVQGLLDQGLVDRCITRDLDWGIKVPLPNAEGKRIYVWFDAPIGYVSNLKEHLRLTGSKEDYRKDWFQADDVEISHFIGKDNIIFHALIFPMMAIGTGFMKVVDEVPANEFLNLEGKQFSKSAGWYVDSEAALEAFGVDALRFYLISAIPETGDTNFSWDSFLACHNDFRNKVGNFAHRSLSFIHKSFPDGLSGESFAGLSGTEEFKSIGAQLSKIRENLSQVNITKAQAEALMLGQLANEYFQKTAPWKLMKENPAEGARALALSALYIAGLAAALQPFVPGVAARLMQNFSCLDGDAAGLKSLFADAYNGNWKPILEALSSRGLKLDAAPTVLLPQIEPEKIAEWKGQLGAKA
jgi:methionyl-tRNA synthetase